MSDPFIDFISLVAVVLAVAVIFGAVIVVHEESKKR